MSVIKCKNNHFYDDKLYEACPICQTNGMGECLTIPTKIDPYSEDKTERYCESVSQEQKTIYRSNGTEHKKFVTGWLVAIDGLEKGKSFQVFDGRNFIGRDFSMDIIIANDNEVSREKHMSIIYDKIENKFYALRGKNISYINGSLVDDAVELKENDIIDIGKGKYVFVPYCIEGRLWNE
ncbi:MAG: FHA domain-containing protein [Candidatus Gastranaerophilaceae bacterium]